MNSKAKARCGKISPPVDVYIHETAPAASETSTITSISNRGQVNIDLQ